MSTARLKDIDLVAHVETLRAIALDFERRATHERRSGRKVLAHSLDACSRDLRGMAADVEGWYVKGEATP